MLKNVPAAALHEARKILTAAVHVSEFETLCKAAKVLLLNAIDEALEDKPGIHAQAPKSGK